jgi:hypothetical protein
MVRIFWRNANVGNNFDAAVHPLQFSNVPRREPQFGDIVETMPGQRHSGDRVVDQNSASWNRITRWLRAVGQLRDAA